MSVIIGRRCNRLVTLKIALCFGLAMMTGCATRIAERTIPQTPAAKAAGHGWVCQAFRPIDVQAAAAIDDETALQIEEHNAVWDVLCAVSIEQ